MPERFLLIHTSLICTIFLSHFLAYLLQEVHVDEGTMLLMGVLPCPELCVMPKPSSALTPVKQGLRCCLPLPTFLAMTEGSTSQLIGAESTASWLLKELRVSGLLSPARWCSCTGTPLLHRDSGERGSHPMLSHLGFNLLEGYHGRKAHIPLHAH